MTTWWLGQKHREFLCCRYSRAERPDLSEQFVVTSQQLKEELQESRGVDQIFIPQKNQRFAERLTGNAQKNISIIDKLKYSQLLNMDGKK